MSDPTCIRCEHDYAPYQCDETGDPLCGDCYYDLYEFTCCWCENYGHQDDMHEMLVVREEVPGLLSPVSPGIYRIADTPYYADGIIEMRLYSDTLERISDVPDGINTGSYPCGHLCTDCQDKVMEADYG